jgi:Ribbon-helix-helix domain
MEEVVRWNIKVSKETDISLRSYLAAKGMKKGDLSKFIEKAVSDHVFHSMVEDIRANNADTDQDELQTIIDDAVKEARAEIYAKKMAANA